MDPPTFLALLTKRFHDNLNAASTASTVSPNKEAQSPVQLRVISTIKTWMETYWFDFEGDLKDKLLEFLENIKRYNEKLANNVLVPLNRKV